jgi:hypothetical protein
MKRRREHGECDVREGGRGCLVYGSAVCTFVNKKTPPLHGLGKWAETLLHETSRVLWVLTFLLGLGLTWAWAWMNSRR